MPLVFNKIWARPLTLETIFVLSDKKIACSLKTAGQISMQFYAVMYLTCFCKWSKLGHIWPFINPLKGCQLVTLGQPTFVILTFGHFGAQPWAPECLSVRNYSDECIVLAYTGVPGKVLSNALCVCCVLLLPVTWHWSFKAQWHQIVTFRSV